MMLKSSLFDVLYVSVNCSCYYMDALLYRQHFGRVDVYRPLLIQPKRYCLPIQYNVRDGTLMIWGGGLGQNEEKNSTATRVGEKNSTQQPGRKKYSSAGWPRKKLISRLVGELKPQHEFLPEPPPQIINGPSLIQW